MSGLATCLTLCALMGAPPPPPSDPPAAPPAETPEVDTLFGRDIETRLFFSIDSHLSEVDGLAMNFTGFYGGLLLDRKLVLGGAAYGSTNHEQELEISYGGFVAEYFHDSSRLLNVSARVLVGGGGVEHSRQRLPPGDGAFFIVEPELRLFLNVTRGLRLGVGLGRRFVSGVGDLSSELSGVSASATLTLKGF